MYRTNSLEFPALVHHFLNYERPAWLTRWPVPSLGPVVLACEVVLAGVEPSIAFGLAEGHPHKSLIPYANFVLVMRKMRKNCMYMYAFCLELLCILRLDDTLSNSSKLQLTDNGWSKTAETLRSLVLYATTAATPSSFPTWSTCVTTWLDTNGLMQLVPPHTCSNGLTT